MRVACLTPLWIDELEARLDHGIDLVVADVRNARDRNLAVAEAQIVISVVFDREMAEACKRLEMLICPAAGTERIDRTVLPEKVRFIHGTGHEVAIAEYVIGALIALRRKFSQADSGLRRGEWLFGYHHPDELLAEISGTKLGLIGFGGIAHEVMRRAQAFAVECAAVTLNPQRHPAEAAALVWLGSIANSADVDHIVTWPEALVICCELSSLTQGLLNSRRFSMMKKNAVLINVARGEIAAEKDLFEALQSRRIEAAAIDVWYQYPHRVQERTQPSRFPFHELDNVLMTPHCSGWTEQNKERRLSWMSGLINTFAREKTRAV